MYIELSKEEIREILEKQLINKLNNKDVVLRYDIIYHDGTYDSDGWYETIAEYVVMNSICVFGKKYESQNFIRLNHKEVYECLQDAFDNEGYTFDFVCYMRSYGSDKVNGMRFYLKEKELTKQMVK